jgi:hypothetical protein
MNLKTPTKLKNPDFWNLALKSQFGNSELVCHQPLKPEISCMEMRNTVSRGGGRSLRDVAPTMTARARVSVS